MPYSPILIIIVAAVGALAAGATALSRPRVALAILFLLASFSRMTLETPLGTMRPEMPAIAMLVVVLIAGGRFRVLANLTRSSAPIALAFGGYLFVLAVSSALIAPGTSRSLHMVAWVATSMLGGVVAYVLMQPKPMDTIEPLAFAGAFGGAAGILIAVAFLVAGPSFTIGVQDATAILPRVYALSWEANLYASFLCMVVFFAFEAARGPHPRAGLVMLALVLIGFPLGITRGAYAGLAVGAAAYAVVRITLEHRAGTMLRTGAFAGAMLAAGIFASIVLLPNIEQRPVDAIAGVIPSAVPGETGSATTTAGPSGTGTTSPGPSVKATSTPALLLDPYPDTLAFRLERVPIALSDLRRSPVIGFGAESFGQEHPDRYAGPGPDHIAIMAVVVPYESGLVGAASLAVGFALLFLALWRTARRAGSRSDWPRVGLAAAYIGSLASVLAAYQLNNALQLAINWIVIGTAVALTAQDRLLDAS